MMTPHRRRFPLTSHLLAGFSAMTLLVPLVSANLDIEPATDVAPVMAAQSTDATPEQTCTIAAQLLDASTLYRAVRLPDTALYSGVSHAFRLEADACVFNLTFHVDDQAVVQALVEQSVERGEAQTADQVRARVSRTGDLGSLNALGEELVDLSAIPQVPHLVYEVVVESEGLIPGYTLRSDQP